MTAAATGFGNAWCSGRDAGGAELRVRLHEAGRRINVNDLWTAAVAISNDLPVVTQDDHFDALAEIGALRVVRV
jgi:predicted nucleic acid-binding protein